MKFATKYISKKAFHLTVLGRYICPKTGFIVYRFFIFTSQLLPKTGDLIGGFYVTQVSRKFHAREKQNSLPFSKLSQEILIS